jgi:hypothetical protein
MPHSAIIREGGLALHLHSEEAKWTAQPQWWFGQKYRIEADRAGLFDRSRHHLARLVGDGCRGPPNEFEMPRIEFGAYGTMPEDVHRLDGYRQHLISIVDQMVEALSRGVVIRGLAQDGVHREASGLESTTTGGGSSSFD